MGSLVLRGNSSEKMHLKAIIGALFISVIQGFNIIERGKKFSEDPNTQYSMYITNDDGRPLSSWHDVPLMATEVDRSNQTYNMIVEIPRFSQAKFEISRERRLNPIVQDKKDSMNRFLPNVFPWHGHVCNYGAFPQTWENPFHKDPWTGLDGDKDPIDVCEIGSNPIQTGTVVPVKVLGILAMLDDGETDWKVIAINAKEASSRNINNMDDLNVVFPDLVTTIKEFFRVYKMPAGEPENHFGFDGEFRDAQFAKDVIEFTHEEWIKMIQNCSISGEDVGSFNTVNTDLDTPCTISHQDAQDEVDSQPQYDPHPSSLPSSVIEWEYIERSSAEHHQMSFLLLSSVLIAWISQINS